MRAEAAGKGAAGVLLAGALGVAIASAVPSLFETEQTTLWMITTLLGRRILYLASPASFGPGPEPLAAITVLGVVLSLLLYALVAAAIFLAFRQRKSRTRVVAIATWATLYVCFVLFLFPFKGSL